MASIRGLEPMAGNRAQTFRWVFQPPSGFAGRDLTMGNLLLAGFFGLLFPNSLLGDEEAHQLARHGPPGRASWR